LHRIFKTRAVEAAVLGLYMKKNEDWRKYDTHTHCGDGKEAEKKTNFDAQSERKEYRTTKT